MNRGLYNARRRDGMRGVFGGVNAPKGRAWKIGLGSSGVEDDMRKKTIFPLATEEGIGLINSLASVVMRVAHGDEGGVPGPLVRVEIGGWEGGIHVGDPVGVQNSLGVL